MVKLVIDGVGYDVSEFEKSHPGGQTLLESYANMDATDVFNEFHHENTAKLLESLPKLDKTDPLVTRIVKQTDAFDKEVRELRKKFVAEGHFKADMTFFGRKFAELCIFLAVATLALSKGLLTVAVISMGIFYQQCGWFSHDIGHKSVFPDKKTISQVSYLTANIFQGFTPVWWVPKHMLHHGRPNAIDEKSGAPVEEDFDTAPLIVWTEQLLSTVPEWVKTYVLPFQGVYMWMVLPVSKLFWDYQSLSVAILKKQYDELFFSLVHYVAITAQAFYCAPHWTQAVQFMLLSRLLGGFLIAFVFIQSHNGMEYYQREQYGFYRAQMVSTRNLNLDVFTTWFTGGLNYQIEHHLFPRMPRHQYPVICDRVRALCEKNGLPYEIRGIWNSSAFLTTHLTKVGFTKKDA